MKRLFLLIAAFLCVLNFGAGDNLYAATFTVSKPEDTNDGLCDADCSLREAVAAANAAATDDVIEFSAAAFNVPQKIDLINGELRLFPHVGTLTINGTGANLLTFDGLDSNRLFYLHQTAVVSINDVTITRGNSFGEFISGFGGAIYIFGGDLTLNRVIIRNSRATHGAGIYNGGFLTINNCALFGNTMNVNGSGGAILNNGGMLSVTNSTLSGNIAGSGGGFVNQNGASAFLTNATIVNNKGITRSGGVENLLGSTVTARNTIIADNFAPVTTPPSSAHDFLGILTSQGYNLIESVEGTTITGIATGNITGQDPQLLPLASNGGSTPTHALGLNSSAIDRGDPNNSPRADQRGYARPADGDANGSYLADIGAFELNAAPITAVQISGRVTTVNGRRAIYTRLILVDDEGNARFAVTNSFGYYRFSGVPVGRKYTLTAQHKQYQFVPKIFLLMEDADNINFIAEN